MNKKKGLVLTLDIQLVILVIFISRHVTRVAKYIKSKRPNVKLFIWHDMLSQLANSGYNNVTNIIYIYILFKYLSF